MASVDLNCDMGEGTGNDQAIMPFISSANISCGYHAGDEQTMRETILLCQKNNVSIGAHPSFPDKENFGRKMFDCSPGEVYNLVAGQVNILKEIANGYNATLHHVKPHGALYNLAAIDSPIAKAIAQAVKDIDARLIIYGLSESYMIREAIMLGLKTASEVFADRTYREDGSLTPRSDPGSLIEDEDRSVQQVLQMVNEGYVTTITGKKIPIIVNTICIHGDGRNAVSFAQRINQTLKKQSIVIQSI